MQAQLTGEVESGARAEGDPVSDGRGNFDRRPGL
jgi:hypothetical protein